MILDFVNIGHKEHNRNTNAASKKISLSISDPFGYESVQELSKSSVE